MTDDKYTAPVAELIADVRLNPLDGGQPNMAARPSLEKLKLEDLAGGAPHVDPDMGRCCLAGLWLYHNFLEESHNVSQGIHNSSGSYWHAIMHRREPDAGNAAYWFRRVGEHPVFKPLATQAQRLAIEAGGDPQYEFLVHRAAWDPFGFIDLCESARGSKTPTEQLCRRIQLAEWELLFDFCLRAMIQR